ncbi:inhibitor of growth protein 1 homolog isoform X2 [Condylostylus longicornis]|nr:inhibitor of growth protein 1 homolog isoform X2 [Condylostylus longicornis]
MVNNQTSFKLVPPPELKNKIDMLKTRLANIRKERPAIFCGLVTFILATLAIIGHLISGASVVLIGLILAGLISTRYNFRIVKVPLQVDFTWVEKYDNDLVDEFLPEVNDTNRFVLDKAGDEAIITPTGNEEDKSDEIPPDLMIPGTIPEINENSDSSDDDLLLKDSKDELEKLKSKNDQQQQMHFKKGYFKKDSSISTSSSDEESLSKGLNFDLIDTPRIQSLQKSQSQPSSTREQANTVVTNLVSGLVAWSMGGGGGSGGGGSGSSVIDTINTGLNSSTATTATNSQQNLNDDKLSKKQHLNSAKFDNIPLNDDGGNRTSEDESDFEILDTDDLNVNNL